MRDRAAPSSPRFFSSLWFAITAFRAADISVRVIDVRSLVRVGTREEDTALQKNLWVKRTGLMGAVRPQTPHRSPRQAFGGNLGKACLRQA